MYQAAPHVPRSNRLTAGIHITCLPSNSPPAKHADSCQVTFPKHHMDRTHKHRCPSWRASRTSAPCRIGMCVCHTCRSPQLCICSLTICSSCCMPGRSLTSSWPTTSISNRCSSSCKRVPRVAAAPGPPPAAANRSVNHARRTHESAVVMAVPVHTIRHRKFNSFACYARRRAVVRAILDLLWFIL